MNEQLTLDFPQTDTAYLVTITDTVNGTERIVSQSEPFADYEEARKALSRVAQADSRAGFKLATSHDTYAGFDPRQTNPTIRRGYIEWVPTEKDS